MIREILSLPEPVRTARIEELPDTTAVRIHSKDTFPVRYCGKIVKVVAGENAVSKDFGLYLLRKYPQLSETPLGESEEVAPSTYFAKLVAIKGIGEKSAAEIEKEFPNPAQLLEAAKTDRLPDQLIRFKDSFLEVFK